eukprot:scaffold1486_cov329-Prasinococcus_capsulatus_cf.AAC.12
MQSLASSEIRSTRPPIASQSTKSTRSTMPPKIGSTTCFFTKPMPAPMPFPTPTTTVLPPCSTAVPPATRPSPIAPPTSPTTSTTPPRKSSLRFPPSLMSVGRLMPSYRSNSRLRRGSQVERGFEAWLPHHQEQQCLVQLRVRGGSQVGGLVAFDHWRCGYEGHGGVVHVVVELEHDCRVFAHEGRDEVAGGHRLHPLPPLAVDSLHVHEGKEEGGQLGGKLSHVQINHAELQGDAAMRHGICLHVDLAELSREAVQLGLSSGIGTAAHHRHVNAKAPAVREAHVRQAEHLLATIGPDASQVGVRHLRVVAGHQKERLVVGTVGPRARIIQEGLDILGVISLAEGHSHLLQPLVSALRGNVHSHDGSGSYDADGSCDVERVASGHGGHHGIA